MTDADHGEILVQGKKLALERHGDAWLVRAPQRTEPAKRR